MSWFGAKKRRIRELEKALYNTNNLAARLKMARLKFNSILKPEHAFIPASMCFEVDDFVLVRASLMALNPPPAVEEGETLLERGGYYCIYIRLKK